MPYFECESSESNLHLTCFWEVGEGGECQVVDVTHPTSSSGCRSSMDLQAKSSSSSVNINKEDQDSNLEIFKSNYANLPNYLRSSLDYCSLNGDIPKNRLVKYMLAEGLVEEKAGEILEDTASNILRELISLGMIEEEEKLSFLRCDFDGPSIKVVNPYHKLSVVKVDKQGFLAKPQDSPISCAYVVVKEGEDDNPLNFKSHPIRFLCMQHHGGLRQTTSIVNVCYSQFLLVLYLGDESSNYLPDQVGDLVHLRYLGLGFSQLKELPQTLGNLRNLQTLEVERCAYQLKLPVEVLKIQNLRHLKLSGINDGSFIVPKGIDRLVNLYTCWGVCARGGIVNELSRLTQLRELGIRNVSEDNISEMLAGIMKMENLVSLSMEAEQTAFEGNMLDFLPAELESFSPPPLLQELHLGGGLFEMPNWLASMVNLTRLSLFHSNLSENPSLVLQFLPELKNLYLGFDAYNAKVVGKEFCSANGFPKLESLLIDSHSLIEWTEVLDGAFPKLRFLNLAGCWRLRFLPEGLQNITTLEELYLPSEGQDLARRLKGEENYKIKHISKIDTGGHSMAMVKLQRLVRYLNITQGAIAMDTAVGFMDAMRPSYY